MTLREAFDGTIRKTSWPSARWRKCGTTETLGRADQQSARRQNRRGGLGGLPQGALGEELGPPASTARGLPVRAILRRIGPGDHDNPNGLGIIPRIPYMKPTKVIRGLPRRVDQEDLSRFYIACEQMQSPKWGGPAAYWWQAWLVVAYFSGLRKGDVFAIRFADLDLEKGTLLFTARKTAKPMRLPLHPCHRRAHPADRTADPRIRFRVEHQGQRLVQSALEWICRKGGHRRTVHRHTTFAARPRAKSSA